MNDYRGVKSGHESRQTGTGHLAGQRSQTAQTRHHSAAEVADEDAAGSIAGNLAQKVQGRHGGPTSTRKSEGELVHPGADVRELHEDWHMQNGRPWALMAAQRIHNRQWSRGADDTISVLCGSCFPLPLGNMPGSNNKGSIKSYRISGGPD